ncbi:HAD-IA family hydrolase [Thalassotalea atypica]|uniref:HAD-IA family hydrolase n=1 Tax=Thalassotalea atypica TaxID=2054316 RepID=UPI002573A555|nr:HAD-IA family hydrolase [Thalassotalea atypica]
MEHYKLVIFDWDGTLIDSIGRIVSSLQQAAISCHLPAPCDISAKGIIGLSLPEAIKQLFPARSAAQEIALIEQYKIQYRELDTTPSPLFSRSIELLQLLKSQDRKLAVATGKGREGLKRVWQDTNIGHLFDGSICSDEAKSKPHPQMLHHLLNEFSLAPSQAVMIGDSKHDLKMAANAGIDSIGVTIGVDNEQELLKHNPKVIVHSLSELEQLFS